MRRPTGLEWVAWALHAGAKAIDAEARTSGLPFRAPAELNELAEAFVNLARLDVAANVADGVAGDGQTDDVLVSVSEVAAGLSRSRRTVERRCRDRDVPLLNGHVRKADVERLK